MREGEPALSQQVIKTGAYLECLCPHCHGSLVDDGHVNLHVTRRGGDQGSLLLSPLLNVFDTRTTISLEPGEEVADLSCARCRHSVQEPGRTCDECGAQAARIQVLLEGEAVDFFICLRNGCHWHSIGEQHRSRMILEVVGFRDPDEGGRLVHTGTKLHCHCPACEQELVENDDLVVHLRTERGQVGVLKLSPHLNVFRAECDLEMMRGEAAADMLCPKCGTSMLSEHRCELCGAGTARFRVRTLGSDVDFFICIRRQCHWHGLDDEARRRLILDSL